MKNCIFGAFVRYICVFYSGSAMSENISNLTTKIDSTYHVEITIERPAKEIWPFFVNMRSWIKNYKFETIEGEVNKEGEVIKLTPLYDHASFKNPNKATHKNYYFRKNILIVPLKKIVFKVYPDDDGGAFGMNDFIVYYTLMLVENSGVTTLTVDRVVEIEIPVLNDNEVKELKEQSQPKKASDEKSNSEWWEHNLRGLKKMVMAQ